MNIFRLSGKLLTALTKYLSMVEPRTEQQATRNINPLHAPLQGNHGLLYRKSSSPSPEEHLFSTIGFGLVHVHRGILLQSA
nr:hypothetical protein Q903MT_gene2556 [Picea sitchensis]